MKNNPNIPDGWVFIPLNKLASTTSGGTPRRSVDAYYGGDFPWIKSGELNDDIVDSCEEAISQSALDESSAKLLPRGTLLIAMYGATVGKLGILGIEAATNQAICAITTKESLESVYLFWYLRSIRKQLIELSYGGAQPNISQQKVRSILIPIPYPDDVEKSLQEQRRIVARIESLFTEVERAKKLHENIMRDTDQLMQSLLNELIPNPYTIQKEGFIYAPLEECCTEESRQLRPGDTPDVEFNYWGLDAINAGEFSEPARNIVMGKDIASTSTIFTPGQVLYCKLRPYLNKVIVTSTEGIGSTEWVVLQPETDKITPDYLANVMRSQWFVNTIMKSTTGARMPRARKSVLRSMLIPIPSSIGTKESLEKQTQIVLFIQSANLQIENMKQKNKTQEQEFDILLQSILAKAFRGEL
jgi:type I restriction enzyme, S subunit